MGRRSLILLSFFPYLIPVARNTGFKTYKNWDMFGHFQFWHLIPLLFGLLYWYQILLYYVWPCHFSGPPSAPNGLAVAIKSDVSTPVTTVISWMALMDSVTGIPPGGNQTLKYFVEVSNSNSAVLFSATVDHPTDMVEGSNFPACENLTVSVTAENLFFKGTTASEDFMTVEPGW